MGIWDSVKTLRSKQRQAKKKIKAQINKNKRFIRLPPKLKFYYGWFWKHCRVHENRMLFESFHGKELSDSSLAVLQTLAAREDVSNYEIYYGTLDYQRDKAFIEANNLPVKLVNIKSRKYPYILATSKYLLNNSSFPVYFIRRDEQIYVQTWHGTPLKTLGKRMRLGMESMNNVQHNFLQASMLTFPNEFTRHVIMRDYNLERLYTGKVAMVGYPRNAVLMQGENAEIRDRCDLNGYETFVYMPTWRGTSNHAVDVSDYLVVVEDILREVDASLNDKQKLYVKFHSMVAGDITLSSYNHIFPFPDDVGSYDFLSQVDVLITDYSSVMFDFALTGKPILLFPYDLEEYLQDRGFYFPLTELPFPTAYTTESLCEIIRSGSYKGDVGYGAAFEREFLGYDSPQNSEKVLDLLLGGQPEDVPITDYSFNAEKPRRVFFSGKQRTVEDLRGIFNYADPERDIVVLRYGGFTQEKSEYIYDNFLDGVDFVFMTYTTPRTFIEDVTKRFWPPTKKRLEQRADKRLFSNLNLEEEKISEYGSGLVNASFTVASTTSLPVSYRVDGSNLLLHVACEGYSLEKLIIANKGVVRWTRDIEAHEKGGEISLDIIGLLNDENLAPTRGMNVRIMLLVREEGSDHEQMAFLVDPDGVMGAQPEEGAILPYSVLDEETVKAIAPKEILVEEGGKEVYEEFLSPILANRRENRVAIRMSYDVNLRLAMLFNYEIGLIPKLSVNARGVAVEGTTIKFLAETEGYRIDTVLVQQGGDVAWIDDHLEENGQGLYRVDVRDLFKEGSLVLRRGSRVLLRLMGVEEATGTRYAFDLMGTNSPTFEDDLSSRYLQPVLVEPQDVFGDYERYSEYELKKLDVEEIAPIVAEAKGSPISISPYFGATDKLSLYFTYPDRLSRVYRTAVAKKVTVNGQGELIVEASLRKGAYELLAMYAKSRLPGSEIRHRFDITTEERGDYLIVKGAFSPTSDMRFDGTYWDIILAVREFGFESLIPMKTGGSFRRWMLVRNYQCDLGDGNIFFPYNARGHNLACMYREKYPSDSNATRAKEWLAFMLFMVLHPYWKRRKMWLVFEKFCSNAQDNGYYFFKYCMENAPENIKKRIFFVIDKNAPDYEKVRQYEPNIVQFMSFKHMLYVMVAKIYIGSDSKPHLYQWRPKPSIVGRRIPKHKIFFLQHGVTAMKRVAYLFGKKGSSPMTYFLTTSEAEQDIVVEHFGFKRSAAPIHGFSRWDVLEDKSDPVNPKILVMPTWRQWLEDSDETAFLGSDYFKSYEALLNNAHLHALLEATNTELMFFIHPKLSDKIGYFNVQNERVRIIEGGGVPLNELIMQCSALVTDYSSVCWDALFMDKPVVFFHFDRERYLDEVGSYIDFDVDLPGYSCEDSERLVARLEETIQSGFKLTEEQKEKAKVRFAYRDKNNRRRTYEWIVSRGF